MCAEIRTWKQGARAALALILVTLASVTTALAQTAAGGYAHTVILKSDGTVWTVGINSVGQLGDGTTTTRRTPVAVSGVSDIVAVAAGGNHSMAITSNGSLYLWGANGNGQLGDASTTTRTSPVQSALTNVVAIAAGDSHSLALRSNGDIYAWGLNGNGQLGTGNTTQQTSPVLVATGGAAVAAGAIHSVFVKSDGTVYATGHNQYGQLGDGSTTQRTSAVQMTGISTATAAAGGTRHTLVLLSDGTVKGAGYNSDGELGDGTTTSPRTSAVAASGLTGVTAIGAGEYHSLALKSDGTVRGWGWNANGRVGDGTTTNRTNAHGPVIAQRYHQARRRHRPWHRGHLLRCGAYLGQQLLVSARRRHDDRSVDPRCDQRGRIRLEGFDADLQCPGRHLPHRSHCGDLDHHLGRGDPLHAER